MAESSKINNNYTTLSRIQVSVHPSDARPYLTRHFPNKYRRRLFVLSAYYGVSLEEMLNCAVGHGLSALEKIRAQADAEIESESEVTDGHIKDPYRD